MVHVWWVQIALNATNVVGAVCPTRKSPVDVSTSAALPTAESGEPEPIVTVTPPLTRVPVTVGSAATLVGDVALPPHPSSIIPRAPPHTAMVAWLQNFRRV